MLLAVLHRKKTNVFTRFFSKVEITASCWNWTASLVPDGYGKFLNENGRIIGSHRFSYQIFKGKIPKNLQIDHLCHNRKCVNPSHLEAVTHKENSNRGVVGYHSKVNLAGTALINSQKTHCKNGHPLIPENMYNLKEKRRKCKTCDHESAKRRYRLKKESG